MNLYNLGNLNTFNSIFCPDNTAIVVFWTCYSTGNRRRVSDTTVIINSLARVTIQSCKYNWLITSYQLYITVH